MSEFVKRKINGPRMRYWSNFVIFSYPHFAIFFALSQVIVRRSLTQTTFRWCKQVPQNSSVFEQLMCVTDSQTDGRTNRQTDGRTDSQTDGRTDRQTDGQTDSQTDRRTDRQTDRQTARRTDGRTDRQTEKRSQQQSVYYVLLAKITV